MATQWNTMTRFDPKSWLLTNGDVITEPPLEVSSTNLKVRVAGEPSTSTFRKDMEDLLNTAARNIAADRNADVWLDLTVDLPTQMRQALGFDPSATQPTLHLLKDPGNRSGETRLWWRFKDSTTPFEALLLLTSSQHRGVMQSVTVEMVMPGMSGDMNSMVIRNRSNTWPGLTEFWARQGYNAVKSWESFFLAEPTLTSSLLGSEIHPHPRATVEALLGLVRTIEQMDSVLVPDTSNLGAPAYRRLELQDSNVGGQLLTELAEYLDGSTALEVVADLYQQMLDTLRTTGITVKAKTSNDFLAALLAAEEGSMSVDVLNVAAESWRPDTDHKVSMHLPTGTFIVECSHKGIDPGEVAEAWQEAKTVASLTGEDDVLMAYAKAYAAEGQKRRTRNILADRKAQ